MDDRYLEGSDRPTSSRGKQEKKERKGRRDGANVDDSCTTDDQRKNHRPSYVKLLHTTTCATYTFVRLATTTPWYSSTKWANMLLQKYRSNEGILLSLQRNDNSTYDDFYV